MHNINKSINFVLLINLAKVPIYSIDKSIINNIYIYLKFIKIMLIGNFSMRVQFRDGKPLPNARTLQVEIFWMKTPLNDTPDIRNYHINQVGQYVTHDISLMPSNFAGKY